MILDLNHIFNYTKQTIILSVVFVLFLPACKQSDKAYQNYSSEISNYLFQYRFHEDSLQLLLNQYAEAEDDIALMLTHKHLGIYYRENARFYEAINNHQEGLDLALQLNDTLEIVQAYNNLGTDFRRIGAYGEASDYHYKALAYAEAYSQVKELGAGMKNYVISLNGIGNVSLSLGYLDDAEQYFRKALHYETLLGSHIGQAINYSNLGAVFEHNQALDSAHFYYSKSLQHNRIAQSDMGIGLCLIHIGNLYEKEENYRMAKNQYEEAFELMDSISDRWHWLQACISIARIHLLEHRPAAFKHYIQMAEETAKEIDSPGHLGEIYLLQYENHLRQGGHQEALKHYKLYADMQDSLRGIHKSNHFMDVRLTYEENKNIRTIQQIEAKNKEKQAAKQYALYFTWAISLVGIIITALLYYAYRQRVRSNHLLKQIEENRTDFFTNITHEFRTPLTVIQGFNRLLKEKPELSEKERGAYMAAIDRQSKNLLDLVNELLDVAKLKSGKDKPIWKKGDIIPYLRMLAENFQLYAQSKELNLIFYSIIESQEIDFVPFYIDKIVGNLLSNAIKHSQPGDKIDFIVAPGPKSKTILLRIVDTGSGIAKDDLEHIFEMFYRSDNDLNANSSGIGLAYTKMMVEKMRGTITVESELGVGTVFTVNLPLSNPTVPYIEQLGSVVEDQSSIKAIKSADYSTTETTDTDEIVVENKEVQHTKPTVLVVEDNRDVITYIKAVLESQYQVIVARNGNEGLRLAERHLPDLVVTDVMMPIKDGSQLCCEMKENPVLNHIPIIMLTAKSSDEDRIKALRCGAEAYIKKPFDPDELLITIRNILAGRKTLVEKFMEIADTQSTGSKKVVDNANLKFLQTLTDIVLMEIQNPDLSTALIAENLAISVSQLNRKMNSITGKSTMSYVLQVKLNKAKKMLQNSPESMADVAHACGFYDQNYFSRIFKKEFGITPTQYMKIPE